ncbi:hypothetical protein HNO88_004448 [Novosphingobium chloroacetimidivorans]|uniref:Transposase n=1 Tax=Novosphingobium chloroacetimidivorans TaxID=1428314 RepID=A0A7W7NZ00_9SPHN|nr:hypothetical protein [Novosphingobium chloroacetimidivorans]
MHEGYGKWNSVYVRSRRWAKQVVWDAMPQVLVNLVLTDDWQHMMGSTTVRGHVLAAGGKGADTDALNRLRCGLRGGVCVLCDNQGLPVGFVLTGGEAPDYAAADDLMRLRPAPKRCWRTKATMVTACVRTCWFAASCPSSHRARTARRPSVTTLVTTGSATSWSRIFAKLKQQRRRATRYKKTIFAFESFLNLAAGRLWHGFC